MTIRSTWAPQGMVVAPHALAAQSGLAVLREGGNALEAMIAAAATVSVVYPHMNGIGGDSFWLIHEPGADVVTIDACGRAAARASADFYRDHEASSIPGRGPLAANTVAGLSPAGRSLTTIAGLDGAGACRSRVCWRTLCITLNTASS